MRLVLIRHSKSCANHVRAMAETEDHTDPLVRASQELRDPPLSAVGERMARNYGPTLRARLRDAGFHLNSGRAIIGSSHLRRAKQTAALLFGTEDDMLTKGLHVFPHITEHGAIPENTPKGMRYRRPDWAAFHNHLSTLSDNTKTDEFIIVGHGSFLKGVWRQLTGRPWSGTFHNLDAFIVEPNGTFRVLRYTGDVSPSAPDQCALPTKIAAHVRMRQTRKHMRKSRKSQKGRKSQKSQKSRKHSQRGGAATPLPLGYFKDGAQMQFTSGEPTGVNYGASTSSWARAPIDQTGGQRNRSRRRQAGGFTPSIMGNFAANGAAYLPSLAAYTGYKLWKNQSRGGSRGQARETRRNRH